MVCSEWKADCKSNDWGTDNECWSLGSKLIVSSEQKAIENLMIEELMVSIDH